MTRRRTLTHHVNVTIPNHRVEPGMVVSRYHFPSKASAERYAAKVDRAPGGHYRGVVEPCTGCGDVTLDD